MHRDLIPFVVTVAVALAGSYFLVDRVERRVTSDLHERPPIVVVDYEKLLANVDPNTPEADRRVETMRDAIKKLSAAGYVVLDGQSVFAAPKDLYEIIGPDGVVTK